MTIAAERAALALFALPVPVPAMNASFTALNATNEAFTAPTSRSP